MFCIFLVVLNGFEIVFAQTTTLTWNFSFRFTIFRIISEFWILYEWNRLFIEDSIQFSSNIKKNCLRNVKNSASVSIDKNWETLKRTWWGINLLPQYCSSFFLFSFLPFLELFLWNCSYKKLVYLFQFSLCFVVWRVLIHTQNIAIKNVN